MKILLTGGSGQLGWAVQQYRPPGFEAIELLIPSRTQLDITNPAQLQQWLVGQRPELIINCAAYTRVDQAEIEPHVADAINHIAVGQLAELANETGARVLHISTDYVFDGKANQPYQTHTECAPQGVYGRSKCAGEQVLLEVLPDKATVIRTSWLYGPQGQNFLLTMLKLMANRSSLSVVVDQIGTPTHTAGLAQFLWWATQQEALPTLLHWADAGVASWYDFATAIMEDACELGLLAGPIELLPIASADYPQAAVRPSYSVLDAASSYALAGLAPLHWRTGLRKTLRQLSD